MKIVVRGIQYESGSRVRCTFDNGDIITGCLHVEDGNRMWICHDESIRHGDMSPNSHGYNYSWVFRYKDEGDFFTENIIDIQPLYKNLNFKSSINFNPYFQHFLQINNLNNVRFYLCLKIKPFENFNNYSISEKPGFIELSGTVKTPNGPQIKKVEIKLARLIKKIFTEVESEIDEYYKMTDHDIERIHNKLVSFQEGNSFKLEFFQGDDILKGYNSENYSNQNQSTLHKSCMSNKNDLLVLYTKIPQVKLACLYSENGLEARCLVWEIDDKVYFDRIYYTYDWLNEMLSDKLKQLGYISLRDTNSEKGYFKIVLNDITIKQYPYVDSFQWFNKDEGALYCLNESKNSRSLPNGTYYRLISIGGNYEIVEV